MRNQEQPDSGEFEGKIGVVAKSVAPIPPSGLSMAGFGQRWAKVACESADQ